MKSHQLSFLVVIAFTLGVSVDVSADKKPTRIFELRQYTTHPGKLPALHARFRDHTNQIFQRHGIELIGYWTPTSGDEATNTLIYILAYPDKASRNKAWDAFRHDSEWQKVLTDSREKAGGPIVKKVESQFLAPTDYSAIK